MIDKLIGVCVWIVVICMILAAAIAVITVSIMACRAWKLVREERHDTK